MRKRLFTSWLLLLSSVAVCTKSQQTSGRKYWWLGLKKSPFGGRNYNSDEIQRGEHIPQGKGKQPARKGANAQRSVKQITKRQINADSDVLNEVFEENEIQLEDIDTECPRRTTCVERFFCERFSGKNVFDQIPCLLTSGDFAGEFGICCESAFSKVCPRVPILPDPKDCLLRPLGDPEDHECSSIGQRSSCSKGSLCCFNGCLNVCLEDPPYSVQKSFFFRQKAIIVQDGRKPEKNLETFTPRKRPDNTSSEEEKTAAKTASERSPKQQEDRVARVLRRLLDRLRGRIS